MSMRAKLGWDNCVNGYDSLYRENDHLQAVLKDGCTESHFESRNIIDGRREGDNDYCQNDHLQVVRGWLFGVIF